MAADSVWSLDSQLECDSVGVCDLPLCQVRLMNDDNFPWLLLVPRRSNVGEITDLADADRLQLMREVTLAANTLRAETGCDKINVAALGNVVAQLHVHVIARFRGDAAWPNPIWGQMPPRRYATGAMERMSAALRSRFAGASVSAL
jgi:diadenosine tetraphosphate (Ap4A) HIT family hydrolase